MLNYLNSVSQNNVSNLLKSFKTTAYYENDLMPTSTNYMKWVHIKTDPSNGLSYQITSFTPSPFYTKPLPNYAGPIKK